MPTAPAQFARSVVPERNKKKSSGLLLFLFALFALATLLTVVVASVLYLAAESTNSAAAPGESVAPSVPSAPRRLRSLVRVSPEPELKRRAACGSSQHGARRS
jgi:hypothetical protein